MKKRAIFFTFTSVLFASMFLLLAIRETSTIELTPISSSIAVSTVNSFVQSLESNYLPNILKISATRTIAAIICEENRTRTFMPNSTKNLDSATIYGNFTAWAGSGTACTGKIMANYTLNESIVALRKIVKDNLNIELNITVNNLTYYQIEPWFINLDLNVTIDLKGSAASWKRTVLIQNKIPVEKLYEPLMIVNTQGAYFNPIKKNQKKIWYISSEAEFKNHLENMTYYENPSAPSFMMRLVNDTTASECCGISTLINPVKVNWPINRNQSYVDFFLFTKRYENCAGGSLFNITGISTTYSPFKIDYAHLYYYNQTANANQEC